MAADPWRQIAEDVRSQPIGGVIVNYRRALNLLIVASALTAGAVATAPVAGAAPAPKIVAAFQDDTGPGGYILYSNGKVNAQYGAPFYGDARKSGLNNFSTMAQDYGGYWLLNKAGKVFQFGSPCFFGKMTTPKKVVGPIIGTVSFGRNDSADGFYGVNANGKLFRYVCPGL